MLHLRALFTCLESKCCGWLGLETGIGYFAAMGLEPDFVAVFWAALPAGFLCLVLLMILPCFSGVDRENFDITTPLR